MGSRYLVSEHSWISGGSICWAVRVNVVVVKYPCSTCSLALFVIFSSYNIPVARAWYSYGGSSKAREGIHMEVR